MKERAKRVIQKLRKEAAQPGWRKSKAIRWTIGIGLTLAIAALFPAAHTSALSGYSVGSLWTSEDINAPFSYPVYKDISRYRQDVHKALEQLYPVYTPDTAARQASLARFRTAWDRAIALLELAHEDSLQELSLIDSAKQLGLDKDDWAALTQFYLEGNNVRPAARGEHAQAAHQEKKLQQLESDEVALVQSIGNLESSAFISQGTGEEASVLTASRYFSLRIRPNEETVLSRDSLMTLEAARNRIYTAFQKKQRGIDNLRPEDASAIAIAKLAGTSLEPNVIYNAQLTQESRAAIQDRVPRTDGIVVEGQKIVSKGDIITPAIKSSLESLSQARIDRGGVVAQLGRFLGTAGHAGVIVLLIVLYLKFIRRKIYNDNAQLLLLALILLFPAVLAYLSVWIRVDFPLEYFILIPVTAMLLTILFDSRTGFYGTVIAALVVAGIRGNDYAIALAGLCAGTFAAYTVRDLRNRAQLFTSIGYIFIGYLTAIAALSLEEAKPLSDVGLELVASLGNALVSPVLTLGALFLIETVFDTVSDLRLTELDNINHPLLRELALRAPGTYQHTMLVAQLAENAAIAIGANPLLAKVGAYYHDVGKLANPADFVENQNKVGGERVNIHDAIGARESMERVRRHVEQGVEMARAHNLPERVIDFIPMHHGTLPISFFYQRAVLEAAGSGMVNEKDFMYAGPSPNTKETAILMLADASEAIARSLAARNEDLTPEAIDSSIEQLIRTRFDQGQFDHCDITVRDLTIIRGVFARLLSGLYHARVQYPSSNIPPAIQPQIALA
ncbi:MAG TPA: HDIG domain-containing protein [Candidatus Kapabacteria bacterium]|jgi:hypothetical protein|nr:HDIG domain-containing protein [Candidatus Kapabacteria bacterium]